MNLTELNLIEISQMYKRFADDVRYYQMDEEVWKKVWAYFNAQYLATERKILELTYRKENATSK